MKILVLSCDKYKDLFEPFHYCMEKYWPDHPEIIYSTETVQNPYYKTICQNYPIDRWSRRIRDTVEEIDDDLILIMCDDCFLQKKVNVNRLNEIALQVNETIGSYNIQTVKDRTDIYYCDGTVQRIGSYKTSVMCSLWNKKALLDCFNVDSTPWEFELLNRDCGYVFLSNDGELPIDVGYHFWKDGSWGVIRGKWSINAKRFFDKEGLNIDYSIRGIYE